MTDPIAIDPPSAAEQSLRAIRMETDVVVLPREFNEQGTALYDDSVLDLVKVLRADGVDAAFAHDTEHRSWIGEKSAEIVISFIVGIASNAGWTGLYTLLRRRYANQQVRAKIARVMHRSDSTTWEWVEIAGPGDQVADIMRRQIDESGTSDGES